MITEKIITIVFVVSLVALIVYVYKRSDLKLIILTKRAIKGNAKAQYTLGMFYEYVKNYSNMEELYGLSCEGGNKNAQLRYATLLLFGDIIEKNTEEGVKWMTASAENGVQDAQFNMFLMNVKGTFFPPDEKQAFYWAEKLAVRKEKEAIEFGLYYTSKIDDEKAYSKMVYYGLKAKMGSAYYIYYYNLRLRKKKRKAYKYLIKAVKSNQPDAVNTFERLQRYKNARINEKKKSRREK